MSYDMMHWANHLDLTFQENQELLQREKLLESEQNERYRVFLDYGRTLTETFRKTGDYQRNLITMGELEQARHKLRKTFEMEEIKLIADFYLALGKIPPTIPTKSEYDILIEDYTCVTEGQTDIEL